MPRVGDADFTIDRLISRANDELANGLGNLVNRVVAMIHRYRQGQVPSTAGPAARAADLEEAIRVAGTEPGSQDDGRGQGGPDLPVPCLPAGATRACGG
ncbi:MAG: class I tRNA ligase family protein [Streptosporangiaceae bacterium]